MAVNKVKYGNTTLIDTSDVTVVADKLAYGYTALNNAGIKITGTNDYDAKTSDATAQASEILSTKTAYVNGQKVTGSMTNRGGVTGTISTKTGSYSIPSGFHDGSGSVSISSAEQAKLVPENIAEGVTILGVTGTHRGGGITAMKYVRTLASASWSNNSQTLSLNGVDSDSVVFIGPAPNYEDAFVNYGVTMSGQGNGTITLSCVATPSSAIDINILILNDVEDGDAS